jgi:hypothetical protein
VSAADSTAGKQSRYAKTERSVVSMSDFQAEIIRLDQGQSESINGMVYGDSNAGKTILSGTLPEKTFWLVCEPGFKTAERYRHKKGLPPHKGARRISDSATAWAAVEWLEYRKRYERLDWIVLDGLSTMQDRFRLAYAAEAFDINPSKRQHRNLPDRPDYFNTQNFLKSWIPRLVDLPVNLLITAHAYRTDATEDGDLLVFPGIQGKVTETANAISGLMDFTAYYAARRMPIKDGGSKIVRRLWFSQPDGKWGGEGVRYIVGDKFDALGTYMDFPTMPRILAKINGEETDGPA